MLCLVEKGVNALIELALGFCFTQFLLTMNWVLLFWFIIFLLIKILSPEFIKEELETEK